MRFISCLLFIILLSFSVKSQNYLLGPQEFNSDILVHGTTAPTTSWFAPNYNSPIDFISSGDCSGSCVGYSGSWNNYWGNFLRLPEVNCVGNNTILMTFHVSNSYFASHTNDWCRFYMWADNGYKHNVVSVKINGTDVTYDSGANGKGFKFSEPRTCDTVEVVFNISAIINKSNILFYLEPSCGYNNSNNFMFMLDNVSIIGQSTSAIKINSPNYNNLNVSFSENNIIIRTNQDIKDLRLYSTNGKLVFHKTGISKNELFIDKASLKKGTYIIQVLSNEIVYNKKIEIID